MIFAIVTCYQNGYRSIGIHVPNMWLQKQKPRKDPTNTNLRFDIAEEIQNWQTLNRDT